MAITVADAQEKLNKEWEVYIAQVLTGFKVTDDEKGLMKAAFTSGFGNGMEYALHEVTRRFNDKLKGGYTED